MRDLLYSGKIPFVKLAGKRKYYFDIFDLMTFVEGHKSRHLI